MTQLDLGLHTSNALFTEIIGKLKAVNVYLFVSLLSQNIKFQLESHKLGLELVNQYTSKQLIEQNGKNSLLTSPETRPLNQLRLMV